jgi:hypothetical protein
LLKKLVKTEVMLIHEAAEKQKPEQMLSTGSSSCGDEEGYANMVGQESNQQMQQPAPPVNKQQGGYQQQQNGYQQQQRGGYQQNGYPQQQRNGYQNGYQGGYQQQPRPQLSNYQQNGNQQRYNQPNRPYGQNNGYRGGNGQNGQRPQNPYNQQSLSDGQCQYCMGFHPKGAMNCPMYGKFCNYCGKINHNSKSCRARLRGDPPQNQQQGGGSPIKALMNQPSQNQQ